MTDHEQRGLIRPLQIVEHEYERTIGREPIEKRSHRVEQSSALRTGIASRRAPVVASTIDLGQEMYQVA
jgi:hypothetical protein